MSTATGRHLPARALDPAHLIPEKEVTKRYPGLFADGELAQLRKAGKIGHIALSRQRVFYLPEDIARYISEYYYPPRDCSESKPCQKNDYSNTADSGSQKNPEEMGSIAISRTPATDVLSAAARSLLEN